MVENRITTVENAHSQEAAQTIDDLKRANLSLQIHTEQNRIVVNQHLKDRDVLDAQEKILASIVTPLKGKRLAVSVVPHSPEAEQFTEKIRAALTAGGLKVSRAGQVPTWPQTPQGFGLIIGASRHNDATILREALAKSGLASGHIPSMPTGESMGLELFVGPKP